MKLESLAIIKKQSKRRTLSCIAEGIIARQNSTRTECSLLRRHKESPEASLVEQTRVSNVSLTRRPCEHSPEAKPMLHRANFTRLPGHCTTPSARGPRKKKRRQEKQSSETAASPLLALKPQ